MASTAHRAAAGKNGSWGLGWSLSAAKKDAEEGEEEEEEEAAAAAVLEEEEENENENADADTLAVVAARGGAGRRGEAGAAAAEAEAAAEAARSGTSASRSSSSLFLFPLLWRWPREPGAGGGGATTVSRSPLEDQRATALPGLAWRKFRDDERSADGDDGDAPFSLVFDSVASSADLLAFMCRAQPAAAARARPAGAAAKASGVFFERAKGGGRGERKAIDGLKEKEKKRGAPLSEVFPSFEFWSCSAAGSECSHFRVCDESTCARSLSDVQRAVPRRKESAILKRKEVKPKTRGATIGQERGIRRQSLTQNSLLLRLSLAVAARSPSLPLFTGGTQQGAFSLYLDSARTLAGSLVPPWRARTLLDWVASERAREIARLAEF